MRITRDAFRKKLIFVRLLITYLTFSKRNFLSIYSTRVCAQARAHKNDSVTESEEVNSAKTFWFKNVFLNAINHHRNWTESYNTLYLPTLVINDSRAGKSEFIVGAATRQPRYNVGINNYILIYLSLKELINFLFQSKLIISFVSKIGILHLFI